MLQGRKLKRSQFKDFARKRKFKPNISLMCFYAQVCRKINEIKRKKLENERSCDMSTIGVRVRNEHNQPLISFRPARSQIRLKQRCRSTLSARSDGL